MAQTNSLCLRQTEVPSSTPLFLDLLYEFDRVSRFYRHPPQVSAIAEAARTIELDPGHREKLVAALREQNQGAAGSEHLDLLAQPGTVVVATGQQVGFYGGPVFSLYKALTALKLAATLRERGTPAVAVFWLATEDHDLDEVSHTWVFNNRREPLRLEAQAEQAAGRPVGGVKVHDPAPDILEQALRALPFGAETRQWAADAYRPGGTFQAGFQSLYGTLLESYGLIFLDPMRPALRQLAQPIFREALANAPELSTALLERNEELQQAGYHAQVHVTGETSLIFVIEQGRRIALHRSGSVYTGETGKYTTEELLQRLERSPQDFSPNALLRPVIQDWLLPTAAYVGGPAELAYLAQASVLYDRLLGRMPVVLPRASFTVLELRAQRLFERYGLSITDCFEPLEELRRKIADRLIPPALDKTLSEAQAQINNALDAAERDLEAFDPTLRAALGSSARKIRHQFSKIRGKVGQESLRRDERAEEDAAYLSHLLFPEKNLQERVYSVLPFVAQHGFDFVDRIYAAIQPDCHDHQVWSA